MLIGINPVISPELLDALFRMGHGDEIVLADAFFPGDSMNSKVIRADGIRIPELLEGILALINLDSYVSDPLVMMAPVPGDSLDMMVEQSYRMAIDKYWPKTPAIQHINRFSFYERAKNAFAIVMTGETAKYGNIILKKGIIPTATSDYSRVIRQLSNRSGLLEVMIAYIDKIQGEKSGSYSL
jgi:L-fucose mutarotase